MGWKSTIELTRREAINAIMQCLEKTPYDEMSNEELEEIMYGLGLGDDIDKPILVIILLLQMKNEIKRYNFC
jgi:hypothetical protein